MSRADVTSVAPEPDRTDAELVLAARRAESGAFGQLFGRWYDPCFDLARNVLQDQEVAAEVARDAFLAGWDKLPDLRDPGAFGGWVLRITRNQALHRLQWEQDARNGAPTVDQPRAWALTSDPGAAEAAEWVEANHLLRLAAAALGPRDLSLLDLHLRHGLEAAEIAVELQITVEQAGELLMWLRGRLRDTIGAALLWREGDPACAVLAAVAPARFDADSAAVIRRHQRRCGTCSAELRRHADLEQLFVTIPCAVVPAWVKTRAVHALSDSGVPVVTAGSGAPPTGSPVGGRPGSGSASGPALPRPADGVVGAVKAWAATHPLIVAGAFMVAVLGGVAAVSLLSPGPGPPPSGGQQVVVRTPATSATSSRAAPVVSRAPATPKVNNPATRRSTRRSAPTKTASAPRSTRPGVPTGTAPAAPISRNPTSPALVRPDPFEPSTPVDPPLALDP